VPEIVIVTLLTVPGKNPQYTHPGSGLGVLLLVSVLNVRPVLVLGSDLYVRLVLLSLVLVLSLLVVLEQTAPMGQVAVLD
jgi:hypothetical protein